MTETTTQAAEDTTTSTTDTTSTDTTTKPNVVPATKKADDTTGDTSAEIERLKRELADARSEAGKTRVNAKEKAAQEARDEVVKEIGKSLGLIKDGEDADPKALRAEIDQHQEKIREQQQELAVYQTAGQHTADAVKLLDSRRFLASIKDIDPTDTDAISAAIKKAVDNDPALKAQGTNTSAAQAAKASGTATTGGSGEGAVTPEQFKAMGYDERVKLLESNPALYRQLAGR